MFIFIVALIALGIFSTALILYFHLKTTDKRLEVAEDAVKLQEDQVVTAEAAVTVAEEQVNATIELAIIKDPISLWIVHQLKGDDGSRSGIPNTIALSLRKKDDPNMLLHVPYFLQEMQKDGFTIVGDGRLEKYEANLMFAFREEGGERFVLQMSEIQLTEDMVYPTAYLTANKVDLVDWKEFQGHANGKHLLAQNLVLHVNKDCDTDCRIEAFSKIRKHIENSRVEVRYPAIPNQFFMQRPIQRPGQSPAFDRVVVKAGTVPEKIISLSYPEANVNGNKMSLGTLFDKLVKLVSVGKFNAVVTGEAGWGKSQLAKYLARLLHGAGVTTIISEDKFPMETAIDLIRQRLLTEGLFWVVEDAQRLSLDDLSALFNFMDGATSPSNLSTMVLYNPKECDQEKLKIFKEALEREGRTSIKIELSLLDTQRATDLKDSIASLMSDLVEKGEWTPKEQSLAQVWNHFMPKAEKEIFG